MQEQPHLYGALYALRILSNKYEFKDLEDRKPMQDVVNATFPTLLQIFQVRLAAVSPSSFGHHLYEVPKECTVLTVKGGHKPIRVQKDTAFHMTRTELWLLRCAQAGLA